MMTFFTEMVVFILTFIAGIIHATDVVPDNQVWTPATATFFYGQENANITCKFRGTPYGVYWMKGSTPASAATLVSYINEQISGPRFDDGSLTITPDYSLVFNNIQASDVGNYICRVSNHNGFLIVNNTDVRVLDPKNVAIFTEPSVTEWAGHSVSFPCLFLDSPERVLWNRVQGEPEAKTVETVLRYTSGSFEVLGDRGYSWSDNYGMIIRDVQVLHEGNFTCMVSKTGAIEIENTTHLAVHARAEEPYLQIAQCESQPKTVTNGTTPQPCQYNVTEDRDSFELRCSVKRVKPVVDIIWQEGSMNLTAKKFVTKRSDGAFDVTATISRSMNQSEFTFTCITSGLAVNGTAQRTVVVRKIKVKLPATGIPTGAIVFIVILLVLAIPLCLVFLYRFKTYKSRHQDYSDCARWAFCFCRSRLDGQRSDVKSDVEQPLKTKTELECLRDKVERYQPDKETEELLSKEDSAIRIGLFGEMGAGKSSFINSLKFALSGTYKNTVVEAENFLGGSSTKFREAIDLTEHIHVLDNRGMKDFDTEQIKEKLMPQICGERGLKPDEEILNGKDIHCPIFVCDCSRQVPAEPMDKFIRSFNKKVYKHCGRYLMVAVTHVKSSEEEEDIKTRIHNNTDVPRGNIWTFDNYTEAHHESNESKDIQYLTFLEKCLEIAERSVKFVAVKKDEKKK